MKAIESHLARFLSENYTPGRSLLLGYSGGCDSTALLYALLKWQKRFDFDLHLAHVDHQMRASSTAEAQALEKEANSLNLPFHLHTITSISKDSSNLEERCRDERLKFFESVAEEIDAQALLLAHHGDDRAETTLKRLFEGARLYHLGAFSQVRPWGGREIWRPLVPFKKGELIEFLTQEKKGWIEDETNCDPSYLRSKMRVELIPLLDEQFGKRISGPLQHVADECQELKEYWEAQFSPYLTPTIKGPFGECFDLRDLKHAAPLRWVLSMLGLISFEQITEAIKALLGNKANISVGEFFIDRGYLFRLARHLPAFDFRGPLISGQLQLNDWAVHIKEGDHAGEAGWQGLFGGKLKLSLPPGDFTFGLPQNKRWNSCRIPVPLRSLMPTLYNKDEAIYSWIEGGSREKGQVFTIEFERAGSLLRT